MQTIAPAAPPAAPEPGSALKPGEAPKAAPVAIDGKWRPKPVEGRTRDEAVLTKTAERFAKLGLNAEQSQALVDYSDELAAAGAAASQAAAKQQHADWWKTLEADKELGGAKFKENLEIAKKGAKALLGEDGLKEIEEAGLTNYPPLVRAMFRAGSKIGEDVLQDGNRPAPPIPDELAKVKAQYPNSPELWDPNHPKFQGAKR